MTIRPLPETLGRCPRDDAPLVPERIHATGTRWLVRGRCSGECGHAWLQDLPSGHGLLYPTSLDVTTGDPFGMWFVDLLVEGASRPDEARVALDVRVAREVRDVVLLPCLDFVYGHALLKLLNAQRHLDAGDALVVIVPSALADLVPEGVAETWVVNEPLPRLRGWLAAFDEAAQTELARFDTVRLSPAYPHPHPSTWDLERFTGGVQAKRLGRPSIVWVDRTDRLWGGSADAQSANVAALWGQLCAVHPGIGGAIVGVGEPTGAPPGMTDLRSPEPDEANERSWLAVQAGADVAIGVHGSSLLLPSALAHAAIELMPEDRFGNAGQAMLITDADAQTAVLRHQTILGAADLGDVTPERVATVANWLIARHDELLVGPAAGVGDGPVPESAWREPARLPAPPAPGLLDRLASRLRGGDS